MRKTPKKCDHESCSIKPASVPGLYKFICEPCGIYRFGRILAGELIQIDDEEFAIAIEDEPC